MSVADFMSPTAVFSEFCERFPPLSELALDLIELCQVATDEQTPFTQSVVDVVLELDDPHPAVRSPTATTATSEMDGRRMQRRY